MASPDAGSRILIFDTTLRDGEQSPGASLTSSEKLVIARQLALLGVDIIEAGFPASSPDDLQGVRMIAREVGNANASNLAVPIIAGLARANKNDIDKCYQAVGEAAHPRIHTFIATSPIHLQFKLRMTPDEVKGRVGDVVNFAHSLCDDVEFSPEDATRSDPELLIQVLGIAIQAGATTLNIPDTVGYTTPEEYAALMRLLIQNTPGAENVVWSVHCHDDLGNATANTLAGLTAGARQAEVTINGIGERAGNTALEEVVMNMVTRPDRYPFATRIKTREIKRTSVLVAESTGILVQANKAIVGANAFAHEAGIHQDGMLKHEKTYEIMTPESVGVEATQFIFGKHSGRRALEVQLSRLGVPLEGANMDRFFEAFKIAADEKAKFEGEKRLSNQELINLAQEVLNLSR